MTEKKIAVKKILIICVMIALSAFFCGVSGMKASRRAKKAKAITWKKNCVFYVYAGSDAQFGLTMKYEGNNKEETKFWGTQFSSGQNKSCSLGSGQGTVYIYSYGAHSYLSYTKYKVTYSDVNVYMRTPYLAVSAHGIQGYYINYAATPSFSGEYGNGYVSPELHQ